MFKKFQKINYSQYVQQPTEEPAKIANEILSRVNENYQLLKNEEWILGVANAGQGAVIGPTIFTVCYWPKKYQALIVHMSNLEQSKNLPTDQVLHFFKIFNELKGKVLEYDNFQLSAAYLSSTQLAPIPINLKEITHQIVLDLILEPLSNGFNITECCMYKFGNDMAQKSYIDGELRRIGKRITVRVEGGGDILFKVVSAASICAKGVWEGEMDKIKKKLNHFQNIGNGHPNDTRTQNYIYKNCIPVFGYSNEIRFSWETTKQAMRQQGLEVEYYDENHQPESKLKRFRNVNIQQIFI